MKSQSSLFQVVGVLLASATIGFAQTSGTYNMQNATAPGSVIPGALNYVEGEVSSAGQTLNQQSGGRFVVQPSQSLETGNGYAELLLTPGTFLRIGPHSSLRIEQAGLADTRARLVSGSALLEADQVIEGARLSVEVNGVTAAILKRGLYSFDAERGAVRVLDGKLKLEAGVNTREIGKHDQVLLANGDALKKTSFDEKAAKLEPLYVWSEARSRQESGVDQLAAENPAGYRAVGDGWYWNSYASYYGFWPTAAFLYSPFGFGYYPGLYAGGFYGYRGYRAYPGLRYSRPIGFHARVGGLRGGGRR